MSERVADSARLILGSIDGITVSLGPVAVTVLLRGDPVITISTVAGQFLVKTLKALDARPPKSATIAHVSSARDPDWASYQTAQFNDVLIGLHLAEPRLRYRAAAAERIVDQLSGNVGQTVPATDPRFWTLLATWADEAGAMPRSRNLAKFARIYAKQVGSGRISDSFRAWATRTADDAQSAGFRPSLPGPSSTRNGKPTAAELLEPPPAEKLILRIPQIDPLIASVKGLHQDQIRSLVNLRSLVLPLVRARAARLIGPELRMASRRLLLGAARSNPNAEELPPALWIGHVVDAGDAAIAGTSLSDDDRRALEAAWRTATD